MSKRPKKENAKGNLFLFMSVVSLGPFLPLTTHHIMRVCVRVHACDFRSFAEFENTL